MRNVLTWVCKIFIGLIAILLFFQGFLWSFMPESNLAANSIELSNILSLNMIKTDIGAGLLSVAIFLLLFIIKGEQWFLPTAIMVTSYLVIRTISLITDGYHETIVMGVGLEALVLLAVLGLNKLQKK